MNRCLGWTCVFSKVCLRALSAAFCIQSLPAILCNSSRHLGRGRATIRLPRRGLHSRIRLLQRLSVLRHMWSAHCHINLLTFLPKTCDNIICHSIYNLFPGVPLSAMPIPMKGIYYEQYDYSKQYCLRLRVQGLYYLPYICFKKKTAELRVTECGTIDTGYQLNAKTGHCYKFHEIRHVVVVGVPEVYREGGQLVVINSAEEADVVKALFAKYPAKSIKKGSEPVNVIFVGFRDLNQSNVWRTINGQSLEEAGYANWAAGEPNNVINQKQYHGAMYREGGLDDYNHDVPAPFICEKHPHNIVPVPNNG
uniref:Immulectin III n=1 Tax=Manduca sexta TaxID=7130 RepID=Q0VJU5_MANSE|nr:immulectin III [Manduca sexta]